MKQKPKTISRAELARLSFCNSSKMPQVVNVDGRKKRWVGIGWVDEGSTKDSRLVRVED